MSFVYIKYLPLALVLIGIWCFFDYKTERGFFKWVNENWFYKRSKVNAIASLLRLVGIFVLTISLLDLRGEEQKVEGEVSEQRTILLIDSSLSMLAEDIRPNRFQKAIFIARHFIQNSAGHKLSVMLFSDSHKKLVPFTSDRELLDSRVSALKDIGVSGGGTGLSQAIQESLQYFSTNSKNATGNIVIITDAEETDTGFNLKVPDNISIALIGIGTARGSNIPLRDSRGVSQGVKKFQGKEVITKLDESFIKKLGSEIKYYNYWIASSYSLPTEEVLQFFEKSNTSRKMKDDVTIRPVYAEYLLIPAIIILLISYVMKMKNAYIIGVLTLISLTSLPKVKGNEASHSEEKKAPLSEEQKEAMKKVHKYLDEWKQRTLSNDEKMDLASKYLMLDNREKASRIYNENLTEEVNDDNKYDYFNWATAKLKDKNFEDSLDIFQKMQKFLSKNNDENKELRDKVRKNTLLALKQSNQNSSQSNQSKKNKQNKKGNEKKKGKGGSSNEKKDNKEKKDSDKSKDEKKENQSKGDKENQDKSDSSEKKEKHKKKDKKKLPGLLKQLLNDDRKLQKEMLDTSTKEKKGGFERKDW